MSDIPFPSGRTKFGSDDCRAGREYARWSIADLAGRSGVDPLAIEEFERGRGTRPVGGPLRAAFVEHGFNLNLYDDWSLHDVHDGESDEFGPRGGQAFRLLCRERGEPPPSDDELSWPQSPDLPQELFVRPVPEPWWTKPVIETAQLNGPDLPPVVVTKLAAPGPSGIRNWTGYLSGDEAEWVRRNPEAVERWPELRAAMALQESRGPPPPSA